MIGDLSWDPAPLAATAGAAAIAAWLALSPWRQGLLGSALRGATALLLLLALLDVGCRRPGQGPARRLTVLLDRSLSMQVEDSADGSRAEAARTWLAGEEFARWTAGWEVVVDTFGGSITDPGAAVEEAASVLPGAILVVSDGRAAGGRVVEAPAVPLFGHAPGPLAVADAAVLDLAVERREDGSSEAVVEVGAVGGLGLDRPGEVTVTIDGRPAGRAAVPPLPAGERRVVKVRLPRAARGLLRLEARAGISGDRVPGNDLRALVWQSDGAPERVLAVGLAPGWDFAAWIRVLDKVHPGPVDVYWSGADGRLRRVARGGAGSAGAASSGGATLWPELDPARYGAAYLVGDPRLLGRAGAEWVGRFLAVGGRGLFWGPEGRGGSLAGVGIAVPEGAGGAAIPALGPTGRAWLTARGPSADRAPDGSPAWPPLEGLPARVPDAVPDATVLLSAGGRPVAWVIERGVNRFVVALGTGYYRWALSGAGSGEAGEAGRVFWDDWSGAIARWLVAASPAAEPLVRMPAGGRVAAGGRLEAPIAAGVEEDVRWEIARVGGSANDRQEVASGTVEVAARPRAILAGPFEPGWYRLTAQAGRRRAREPFAVESWAPDLAWTAADTASLAAAARASGGALLTGPPPPLPELEPFTTTARGRAFGLGTAPWTFLLAAMLLLADWALAGRRNHR